ncbi:hypothetical protein, partial [Pseudomonas helleri]|uniref:hypothetical protein n=1 Tax=Pseudomonas helleri TaxID=1608996 RepID=UPI003F9AF023
HWPALCGACDNTLRTEPRFGLLLQALVHGESIVFAVGISMLAVGLGTGNAGFWIPGCVLMAVGLSQKSSGK